MGRIGGTMNKIEQQFADALCEYYEVDDFNTLDAKNIGDFVKVYSQYPVGIYIVDFVFTTFLDEIKFVVEIDGQESHKTKEQRFRDYQRERFLQAEGFIIIRFTGSEIFVNPSKCVEEAMDMMTDFLGTIANYGLSMHDKALQG